jgi:hypothetical protein
MYMIIVKESFKIENEKNALKNTTRKKNSYHSAVKQVNRSPRMAGRFVEVVKTPLCRSCESRWFVKIAEVFESLVVAVDAVGSTARDLDCVITMADCGDELLYSVQSCLHHT